MECKVCGEEIQSGAKFCQNCGSPVMTSEESDELLESALIQGEEVFVQELKEAGIDVEAEVESVPGSVRRISALDHLKSVGSTVKKSADSTIAFGKKVGDGTSQAVKKTKEISNDVSRKVGATVDKGKEIGHDVGVVTKKIGDGTGEAVKKTQKGIQDLGQVGVIITQRALDVVRASLRAVEIVDAYLAKKNSNYEIGNFKTGVAIPPYLEIEFHKRKGDINDSEKSLVDALRAAGIKPEAIHEFLRTRIPDEPDKTAGG